MKEAQGTHYDSNLYFLTWVSRALIPFRPQYHPWGCRGWMAYIWKYLLNPPLPWICPWIQLLHHAFMWINLLYFPQGFDDPSALLKHELAYCLGQMQVQFICICIFAYRVCRLQRALFFFTIGPNSFWKLLSWIFLC